MRIIVACWKEETVQNFWECPWKFLRIEKCHSHPLEITWQYQLSEFHKQARVALVNRFHLLLWTAMASYYVIHNLYSSVLAIYSLTSFCQLSVPLSILPMYVYN